MKDYKDEIIEKLCGILNCLEDCGCLLGEERDEYHTIMSEYQAIQNHELMGSTDFGPYSHNSYASYICYSILNDQGERVIEYAHYADDPKSGDTLLRDAAEMICFSDNSDEIVEAIVVQGWKIEYLGWHPDMLFEFRDQVTGEIIWSERFPQWDH